MVVWELPITVLAFRLNFYQHVIHLYVVGIEVVSDPENLIQRKKLG